MATKKNSGKSKPKAVATKAITKAKTTKVVSTAPSAKVAKSPAFVKPTVIAGAESHPNQSAQTFAGLRKWNLILGIVHALQGVVILLLSTGKSFPVTTSYMAVDPLQTAAQGKPVLVLATRHLFDLNLGYIIATFFFLSALAHLIIATRYRRTYETNLAKGVNKARWFEYALSASTMMVAIGLLVGTQDLSLLLALFGGTAVMNLCGLIMETHQTPGQPVKWLSYVVGSIAGIIPWIIIAIYLVGGAINGSSAPTFVYWIFGSIFVFFSCFALNMWLQYKKIGKWADYLYGERVYMVLSLVAKTLLAWQVFAGALRP